MAFSDPQSITISGVTTSLPRVSSKPAGSEYLSSDGLIKLRADHAYGRRTRRVIRIDHAKLTADPFVPSQNVRVSTSQYLVFDIPPAGYTNADLKAIYDGFKALYTGTSDALITKLLGGES